MDSTELQTGRTTIIYQIAPWRDAKRPPLVVFQAIRISVVLYLALVFIVLLFAAPLSFSLPASVAVVLFCAPLTCWVFNRSLGGMRAVKDKRDAMLLGARLDVPAIVGQEFARIDLLANERRYGTDVGIVTAVDGWISFDGNSTRFSLPCSMLRRTLRPGKGARELGPYNDELVIEVGGQRRIVRFMPLMTAKVSTLGELIDRSLQIPAANPGLAVLPPFTAPGGPWRPTIALLFAGVAVVVAVIVVAVIGIEGPEWVVPCILLAALVAAVAAYSTTKRKRSKLRDPDGVWEAEAGPEDSPLVQRLAKYGKWSFDQSGALHDDAI